MKGRHENGHITIHNKREKRERKEKDEGKGAIWSPKGGRMISREERGFKEKQVSRRQNIVVDGWAGAYNWSRRRKGDWSFVFWLNYNHGKEKKRQ